MVKAKDLKLMRKALDQYNKSTSDPLEQLLLWLRNKEYGGSMSMDDVTGRFIESNNDAKFHIVTTSATTTTTASTESNGKGDISLAAVNTVEKAKAISCTVTNTNTNTTTTTTTNGTIGNEYDDMLHKLTYETKENLSITTATETHPQYQYFVRYYRCLPNDIFEQCMDLFHQNMKQMYEQSSWGYDEEIKRNEFKHPNARFIVISQTTEDEKDMVIAFVHYRYCYDDEDQPTTLVVYVYEMQVQGQYQKQGIGQYCMFIIEAIAKLGIRTSPLQLPTTNTKENKITKTTKDKRTSNKNTTKINVSSSSSSSSEQPALVIQKVMLTVFRNNKLAIQFYRHKLCYQIDSSSPSQYNQITDYEILSKVII
jgi:hypothetical protein